MNLVEKINCWLKPGKFVFKVQSTFLICFILFAVILTIYWQTGDFSYVNYDDPEYVYENERVQQGLSIDNIKWAFTTTTFSNWHPLTWISYMIDAQLYGDNPGQFHLTNVILHIANSILLFLLFTRLTGDILPSAFVATLFAVHPLHIQSVAWIAERKDLLSAFFFFTTIFLYVTYVETGRLFRYLLTLISFSLGLMAKPMIITLPCILLLLDFWPLQRLMFSESCSVSVKKVVQIKEIRYSSIIYEKIPFLILSICSAIMTFYAQESGGSVASFTQLPILLRFENAVVSYVLYMHKMFWPFNLSIIYPHPLASHPVWLVMISVVFIALFTIFSLSYINKYPFLAVGWLWFLGMLAPVIGIIQVGLQAMADRYTYLPLIGLYLILSWGTKQLANFNRIFKSFSKLICLLFLLFLTIKTYTELAHWKDGYTLFSRAIEVTKNNYIAHNNLGYALILKDRRKEAKIHFEKALEINQFFPVAHLNLAKSLIEENKLEEGINHYRKAIEYKPDYADAYNNLGNVYLRINKLHEAASYFIQALRYNPNYKETYNNLGVIFFNDEKIDEAIAMFTRAIDLDSNYLDAKSNLKLAIERQNKNIKNVQNN